MQSDLTMELARLHGAVELGDPEKLLRTLENLPTDTAQRVADEALPSGCDTASNSSRSSSNTGSSRRLLAAIRLGVLDEHEVRGFLDAHARELPTEVLLDFAEIHGVAADYAGPEEADLLSRPGVAGELARRPDAMISDRFDGARASLVGRTA